MVAAGDRDLAFQLIRTKLEPPQARSLVCRDQLIGALSDALVRPVTLVCGAAGSGKTTLLAQWLESGRAERSIAWLSLDDVDNDPAKFWIYVVEALRSVLLEFGREALALLRAPGVDVITEALPALINELADVPEPVAIVLDDYHLIHDSRIHRGIAFLLAHMPSGLRVVIMSRSRPPLPIGTLRAQGKLSEIDAARLRFSHSEAEALLNDVHELALSTEMVAQLHTRTEGWAAGLYLAALSIRHHADAGTFVDSFAGSDRGVVDYLGAEVIDNQPSATLRFLLRTSVLDRFCASLCDAVVGGEDARMQIDEIERSNYFLIPLDPRREWYRYHHLFRDLLRHELDRREPGSAAELHCRAGRWFLEAGHVSDAIHHLVASGTFAEASDLIAEHWLSVANAGERGTVAGWLDALPRSLILSDGRLCVARAGEATASGRREEILRWLDHAERAATHSVEDDDAVAVQATVLRGSAWELLGDMTRARHFAERITPLDGSSPWHTVATMVMGTAARWRGEAEAVALLEKAVAFGGRQQSMTTVWARGLLALIAAERGDWRDCETQTDAACRLIEEAGLEEYWMGSLARMARGQLLRHDRRLSEAEAELGQAVALARRGVGPVGLAYGLLALAELRNDLGDRMRARELVAEARERLACAPEPGPLVPRLLERVQRHLRVPSGPARDGHVMTEALTEREHAVLSLLPAGLSAQEIGAELGVSRNTVKTHTKALYRMLGVSARRDAVSRGRALGLL